MSKMVNTSIQKSESLSFFKYLCLTIGSEEVVRLRRLAYVINDIGERRNMITSGSKGEGLDLNGSDLDMMSIDPSFKVYQSETEVEGQQIPLLMNTEETHPCFTKLCLLNHPNGLPSTCTLSNTVRNLLENNYRGCWFSSQKYKLMHLSSVIDKIWSSKLHGPCLTDKDETYDFAMSLKCDKWIYQAKPWISRPRTSWPSTEIITKVVSCGVLFVPIGYKGSMYENLEWRISFSVAEKFLIFSFSHTQFLCYAILKILLKEIIEKQEDLKNLLCSYFLKILMFWILEETEPHLWRPDNFIPCFMACLQRLLYCVKYSILPHFFINDNNLFYLRFDIKNREKLITILWNLFEQGINWFTSSKTLQDYRSHSFEIEKPLISRNIRFLQQIMPAISTIRNMERRSRLLYDFLHCSRTSVSKSLFVLQLSVAFMLNPELNKLQYSSGNKHYYCQYKQNLSHLLIGLHSDAGSGLLKLASFFYVHKQYIASLTVITHALQKYTDEKIYISLFHYKKSFDHLQKHILNLMKKEKLHTIIKSLIIHPLTFELGSSIVPQELQLDVAYNAATFHTFPFAYFLQFLCYYHLHDNTSCRRSLHQLTQVQWTLSQCGKLVFHPETVNSLIFCGIAHQLLGNIHDIHSARQAFKEASRIEKYNLTSAALRLSRLI